MENQYGDEVTQELRVDDIEIVIDDDQPAQVEIYMLNRRGERIEGGTFDRIQFMDAVKKWYNENY